MKIASNQKLITDRSGNSVKYYLSEDIIKNTPSLTREEEYNLSFLIRNLDDTEALHKLVTANLRYGISYAKEFQTGTIPLAELISLANVGLIKAAKRFDGERGTKFITYAKPWIKQSILEFIAEHGRALRLPANRTSMMNKISRFKQIYYQQNGIYPHSSVIADKLELDVEKVKFIEHRLMTVVSMDRPLTTFDGGTTLGDMITNEDSLSPDHNMIDESHAIILDSIIAKLNSRDSSIIKMIYGVGGECVHSLREIGEIFNLTNERIRQIKVKAIEKMKESIGDNTSY